MIYIEGGISSTTTNVQHPPGWCDGSNIVPERPPNTSLLVERRQSDEANQFMGIIRRPWWSEANGEIWPECRGYTPTTNIKVEVIMYNSNGIYINTILFFQEIKWKTLNTNKQVHSQTNTNQKYVLANIPVNTVVYDLTRVST